MNTQLTKDIKSGLTVSLVFIISVGIFGTVFAAISQVSGGDSLTSAKWNEIVNLVNGHTASITSLASTISGLSPAPTGMISAFNGTSCPSGWNPANGSSVPMVGGGTNSLDLRGRFLRGMNSFEGGANLTTTTIGDADGLRTLGNYQTDDNKAHNHTFTITPNDNAFTQFLVNTNWKSNKYGYISGGRGSEANVSINNSGGNEARPRNVAVIYCVKN